MQTHISIIEITSEYQFVYSNHEKMMMMEEDEYHRHEKFLCGCAKRKVRMMRKGYFGF
jgi:hypothetical protein